MIRIGMNKKTGEPVNHSSPFYFKKNDAYTPCGSISFGDVSKIRYERVDVSKRIVWVEASGWVSEVAGRFNRFRIRIDEKTIITNDKFEEDKDVCLLLPNNLGFSECAIKGPCNLIFEPDSDQKVFLETDSEVIINTFKT